MAAAQRRDLLLGILAACAAALWCWGVVATIPGAYGEGRLGPRGFPLIGGVLLGVLGLAVIARSLRKAPDAGDSGRKPGEWGPAASAAGLLAGYALLLELAGFLLATAATVAVAVGPVLGVWRWRLIGGMALGIPLGIYLVLGKLLGVYLPVGRLVGVTF